MHVARQIDEVRSFVRKARSEGKSVALVPTMGYLHEGHLSLVDLARERADVVVASIFVNPTQFGPNEDLATYPRDEATDTTLLADRGVDLLFAPDRVETVYPSGFSTSVEVAGVAEPLEGQRRPGHFSGVATVVLKLFNIVGPDLAVFGQKDAQQCAVIRRIVTDLDVPVEIVVGETVREEDGLAMSSRNSYLDGEERNRAVLLSQALQQGRSKLEAGASAEIAESAMRETIDPSEGVKIDYLRVVDPATFEAPRDLDRDLLLVGAMFVGNTRLIDNMKVERARHSTGSE